MLQQGLVLWNSQLRGFRAILFGSVIHLDARMMLVTFKSNSMTAFFFLLKKKKKKKPRTEQRWSFQRTVSIEDLRENST